MSENIREPRWRRRKLESRIGEKYGKVLILDAKWDKKEQKTKVLGRCDCGSEKWWNNAHDLFSGKVISCGCHVSKITADRNRSHDMSNSAIYKAWAGMKTRATNHKCSYAKDYSLRGITLCERWMKFEEFFKDMGESFREGLTLERVDVNGNYCPENCCWIPASEQPFNQRRSRFLEIDGVRKNITKWAREVGISHKLIDSRIKRGWSEKDAVFTPARNFTWKDDQCEKRRKELLHYAKSGSPVPRQKGAIPYQYVKDRKHPQNPDGSEHEQSPTENHQPLLVTPNPNMEESGK